VVLRLHGEPEALLSEARLVTCHEILEVRRNDSTPHVCTGTHTTGRATRENVDARDAIQVFIGRGETMVISNVGPNLLRDGERNNGLGGYIAQS